MTKPAMKPMKVYLIQNKTAVIIPQINASVFEGRFLFNTIDLRAKYRATERRGKQSSSALPPKLNILIVYVTPSNTGARKMVNLEGAVNSFAVFQEKTANTQAAMHSIIQAPIKDLSEIRAAAA